jgi:hypothetical protein
MGTLVFVCPATGEEVSTGIEMDLATLEQFGVIEDLLPALPTASPNGGDRVLVGDSSGRSTR